MPCAGGFDPGKIASRDMTVDDVLNAVREQKRTGRRRPIGGPAALTGTEFERHRSMHRGRVEPRSKFGNIISSPAPGRKEFLPARRGAWSWVRVVRAAQHVGCEAGCRDSRLPAPGRQCPPSGPIRSARRWRKLAKPPRRCLLRESLRPTVFVRSSSNAAGGKRCRSVLLVVAGCGRVPQDMARQRRSTGPVPIAIVGAMRFCWPPRLSINSLTLLVSYWLQVSSWTMRLWASRCRAQNRRCLAPREAEHAAMGEGTRPISPSCSCCDRYRARRVRAVSRARFTGSSRSRCRFHRHLEFNSLDSVAGSGGPAPAAAASKAGRIPRLNRPRAGVFVRGLQRVFGACRRTIGRAVEVVLVIGADHAHVVVLGALRGGCTCMMFRIVPGGFIPCRTSST